MHTEEIRCRRSGKHLSDYYTIHASDFWSGFYSGVIGNASNLKGRLLHNILLHNILVYSMFIIEMMLYSGAYFALV